jgi:hypothetical protein
MTESNRQYFIFAAIAVALLLCIGGIAFGVGQTANLFAPTPLPPTSTPAPPVVTIQGIKTQAKLATIEYTAVTEIYRENLPEGWFDELLGSKEQLLMLVYGDVRAGFDLEKLQAENLWSDGQRVRLVLPAPEILNSSIDFNRTHIVFYENNLKFEDNNPNLQGDALEQAQSALEKAALEAGILNQANQQGQLYFENFLYSLGFTEVEVVVDAQIFKE